jgi:hypothetical protein
VVTDEAGRPIDVQRTVRVEDFGLCRYKWSAVRGPMQGVCLCLESGI